MDESNLEKLVFEHQDSSVAASGRDDVADLYQRAYVDRIRSGDQFANSAAFMDRFDAYTQNPRFEMVIATLGGVRVGQTWGWPLEANSRWWQGLVTENDPDFAHEDGKRTFALSEIMVARECTGRRIAQRLHDKLLEGRPEKRSTLLVNPANIRARDAYLRWGWVSVAKLKPHWPGSPEFEVLMRSLAS